jgi:hypothetical protein
MAAILLLTFVVLMAPLSYFYGADSRLSSDRGWFGEER